MQSISCGIFGHEEAGHRLRCQGASHLHISRDHATSLAGDAYAASRPFGHGARHRAHQLIKSSDGDFTPEGLL
jgi:hypothetical protein